MVETILALPVIILVGFSIVHLGLVYQTKSNLEYAALMAARVGSVTSISVAQMRSEAVKRMAPSQIGNVPINAADVRIVVLNPTEAMFSPPCSAPPSANGVCDAGISDCEIPNFGLQYRSTSAVCDGASIQDANILRIKVIYTFNTHIPFMNMHMFTKDTGMKKNTGTTISAVATVRMQSPARYNSLSSCAFTATGC